MRTITAAQAAVRATGTQAEYVRVFVKDGGGTFRDLTTYPGFNAVKSVSWKASVESPHITFEAEVARELYGLSLAPLMEDSPLNREFDAEADYEPLLKKNREVKIEVAIVPMDSAPETGDWMEVFRGRIDEIDSASGPDVKLIGRDLGGRLAQQYIKEELVYAFANDGGHVSLRIWSPEMSVETGDYVLPASRGEDDPGFAKFYSYTSGGITGTTEPAWTGSGGITDGSAVAAFVDSPDLGGFDVEAVIQSILDDNRLTGDAAVTLYTPVSPSWAVREFMQRRGFTLEAVRALATQIGWDLRYKWRDGTNQFEFTLYEPERDDPDLLHTFPADDYGVPSRLGDNIANTRNSVTVIIKDRTDLWPDGTPKRKEIHATDPESIADYGELWSEIQEDETGNIDTETEGERLAASFIKDCSQPGAEVAIPMVRGFPWVELNDFYEFEPDNVHYSTAQELAVVAWSQTFQGSKLFTQLTQLRGFPTIGVKVHLDKEYHPTKPPKNFGHRLKHFQAPKTISPTFKEIVGGIHVVFDNQAKKDTLLDEYEIHISADGDPDFIPDETTLVALVKGTEATVPYQNPNGADGAGGDYYGCAVPRWYNAGQLVRGQPSKRKAFKAGRASAGHLQSGPRWGRQPLNGGFENQFDPALPPDHWSIEDGGAFITVESGAGGVSGERWVSIDMNDGGTHADLLSSQFQVESQRQYRATWWVNNFDEATDGEVELYYQSFSDEACTMLVVDSVIDHIDLAADPSLEFEGWRLRGVVLQFGPGDKYVRVGVRTSATGAGEAFYVDGIAVEPWDIAPHGYISNPPAGVPLTTTSSSFAAIVANSAANQPEMGGWTLATVICSMYTTVAPTVVEMRIALIGDEGDTFTSNPIQFCFNQANVHTQVAGVFRLNRPRTSGQAGAGQVFTVEWRRVSGTGTLTIDSNDCLSVGLT